jgi:hypothetical protein
MLIQAYESVRSKQFYIWPSTMMMTVLPRLSSWIAHLQVILAMFNLMVQRAQRYWGQESLW